MTKSILFEAHNLTLKSGTGIATYARHVEATARQLGYRTEMLLDVKKGPDRKNPVLTDIQLYDATPEKGGEAAQAVVANVLKAAREWVTGEPLGIKPFRLPRTTALIDPSSGAILSRSQETSAAVRLRSRSYYHFLRYGRPARLRYRERPDLFHATHPVPLIVPGARNIYTVHDIVPLRLPYSTLDNKRYFYRLIKSIVERKNHIVTVSDFSRRDIIEFFGVPEHQITNTWQSVEFPKDAIGVSDEDVAQEVELVYDLGYKDYFLFFGAIEPKKNITRMVEAFAASGTPRPLVLAGGLGWQYEQDLERIDDERFLEYALGPTAIKPRRKVRRLPYVPRNRLVSLIRGARAVLMPSVYEGFGLPILEAMVLGTPVITSTVTSLPEVAGDAALLADPYDTHALARAIRTMDEDADLRADLAVRGQERAKFFSPENYRARLADLYDMLLR